MTIFMLHNVFSVIYRRVKAKREKKDGRGNVTAKRGMICHPCLLWMAWLRSRNSRISALSARTYVVIPSLHWEGRGGLGVNTSRGLSLSFLCRWEAAPRSTMHLCSLEAPPPQTQQLSFQRVRGVTIFPPGGNSFFFFFQLIYDGCIMASEWRIIAFQCAFLWVSAHTEGQWMRNQHLYKTLFLAHSPPSFPLLPPPPSQLRPPPPTLPFCWSWGIHRRFIWDASTSVRTLGLGKKKNPFLFGPEWGHLKNRTFFQELLQQQASSSVSGTKTLLPFRE